MSEDTQREFKTFDFLDLERRLTVGYSIPREVLDVAKTFEASSAPAARSAQDALDKFTQGARDRMDALSMAILTAGMVSTKIPAIQEGDILKLEGGEAVTVTSVEDESIEVQLGANYAPSTINGSGIENLQRSLSAARVQSSTIALTSSTIPTDVALPIGTLAVENGVTVVWLGPEKGWLSVVQPVGSIDITRNLVPPIAFPITSGASFFGSGALSYKRPLSASAVNAMGFSLIDFVPDSDDLTLSEGPPKPVPTVVPITTERKLRV